MSNVYVFIDKYVLVKKNWKEQANEQLKGILKAS